MDKFLTTLIIGLVALMILVPLGLLAEGTAYGEWDISELQDSVGYAPAGFQQLQDSVSSIWNPILPDYDLPSDSAGTAAGATPGYYISAIIGVLVIVAIVYGIGKVLVKKDN
jgi:hypothetical protein